VNYAVCTVLVSPRSEYYISSKFRTVTNLRFRKYELLASLATMLTHYILYIFYVCAKKYHTFTGLYNKSFIIEKILHVLIIIRGHSQRTSVLEGEGGVWPMRTLVDAGRGGLCCCGRPI